MNVVIFHIAKLPRSYHSYSGWPFGTRRDIAQHLSLGYNLQEKTEFASPKVHLAEEVALDVPTGQSTGGFKDKGTGESIQVMAFLRSHPVNSWSPWGSPIFSWTRANCIFLVSDKWHSGHSRTHGCGGRQSVRTMVCFLCVT